MADPSFAPRRILVVRNDNVGDVLCCTPAIHGLRRAFPQAYLATLVVRYSQDAILGNPDLDEVFVYDKAKHRPDRNRLLSLFKQLQVLRIIKEKQFDLAIGLRSAFSWSEAWLVYFSGARIRLGYEPAKNRDRRFAFFYNERVPLPPPDTHEVEKACHLVKRVGVEIGEKRLQVSIPQEEKIRVNAFLEKFHIDPKRLVGFHLSSRVPANRWPGDHFASLASLLIRESGQKVVLTWGPGDENLAADVQKRAGEGVFLFPSVNFKSLGAIQERCRVFLSSDGGAMHFSVAVGTPTIGLFGKTDPKHWAPWGDGHVTLRKGKQADLISVDEVYQALKKWVKN